MVASSRSFSLITYLVITKKLLTYFSFLIIFSLTSHLFLISRLFFLSISWLSHSYLHFLVIFPHLSVSFPSYFLVSHCSVSLPCSYFSASFSFHSQLTSQLFPISLSIPQLFFTRIACNECWTMVAVWLYLVHRLQGGTCNFIVNKYSAVLLILVLNTEQYRKEGQIEDIIFPKVQQNNATHFSLVAC